jgi:hypothetical protein
MEKTKTQSVSIPASSSYVFDFIADPETLPQHSLTSAVRVRRRFARNAAAGHAAAAAGDQHRPCRARSPWARAPAAQAGLCSALASHSPPCACCKDAIGPVTA